ncbi:protein STRICTOSIDINE SYNTHASE-LIKE 5-like [Prunus avium]|uniref:Protein STRICTOSIDINE SYNTHASE-LIKE 5-like n=1 Tax=Prunus avium TaxID=42229 RepID=A0A6P5TU67_PRUAV|nr:protein STRICTOSIDINE SYNTHASE-LIKE 5-like [Prunus avium]
MQSQYNLMMEGVDVKDPKTTESVAFDGKSMGEIVFRGNTLMLGYLENSKPAHEVFMGGWYRTGDLAVRHPDGYIQMKDRARDIIFCEGEVISTLEVEAVLLIHPQVLEAAVGGKYDEVLGETPCAFVKLKEGWVNTGGRPLGLAFGLYNEVVVADADKGLLNVTSGGEVMLLTDEAEGVKFGITDGVDVAVDGTIYFTDASYKYNLKHFVWDILEGRPYGRFVSYDSATKQTTVLVRDLYFANGLVVSPDQSHVIFCETPMRRCRKYYVQGEKKGSVETFIDQLPGLPDNIRYDGEGHYWIALLMAPTLAWDLAVRYPFIRKVMGIMEKYTGRPNVEKNGGVLAVDLDGNLISHYYDPGLSLVSSVIKIGNHIFCGSVFHPYMLRLNIQQYPAMDVA